MAKRKRMIRKNNLNDEELNIYANCSETELRTIYEPKPGLFIAESAKVINRALDAGYRPVSMLTDSDEKSSENSELIKRMEEYNIPVYEASQKTLSGITGYNLTRGVLCAFERRRYPDFDGIISGVTRVAILEDVVNPTNLGAIFRSAAALGMEAVILTAGSTDPLYRRAARVSMGTVFQIPYTFVENINDDVLNTLHINGFKTVSFALRNNSIDIDSETLKHEEKLAIIMGTEGEGLKSETINKSDYVVKIPMYNEVDSLNVAAASAVAFWELGKRKI